MKVIGKLEGGDRLVVLSAIEIEACETIAHGVFQMAAHALEARSATSPEPAGNTPPPAARTPPERGPGKRTRLQRYAPPATLARSACGLGQHCGQVERGALSVERGSKTKTTTKGTKSAKAEKDPRGGRNCLVCGEPITGSLRGRRKVHNGVCRRAWNAKLARDKYLLVHQAPRAPEGNPSDPGLTDAQRKALQEKRLAAIKASAERIG